VTDAPRHARGRHAKPPSEFTRACDRTLRTVMAERNRRKIVVAWSGTASVALGVAAVVGMSMIGSAESPTAAVAGAAASARPPARSAPPATPGPGGGAAPAASGPAEPAGTGSDAGSDVAPQALSFLKEKDPDESIAKHVREVVQSGDFLRVYTDLTEGQENSDQAISLCEWTTEYLKDQRGERAPVVFVHAKTSGNGNVVLANKQGDKDDCEVGETR
jgi:hypothetical protein